MPIQPAGDRSPPFETNELRRELVAFLAKKIEYPGEGKVVSIGKYKFGVYAFFDYDGEPIYVGQTNEKISTRIRRHLTNQRTDAVAMKVLDPFEVCEIQVWPLPQYQGRTSKDPDAKSHLNWLESEIFHTLKKKAVFSEVLNEKIPAYFSNNNYEIPMSIRESIVSKEVFELRKHPDTRLARRAETLSLLAKVISERQVQSGLRLTLLTQAKRLAWLAERRIIELGAKPEVKDKDDE
jgi:hypothetical protein